MRTAQKLYEKTPSQRLKKKTDELEKEVDFALEKALNDNQTNEKMRLGVVLLYQFDNMLFDLH